MAYIQYAGSPDIFDEKGNYVPSLDWSKNPQITKVNTPRPDIKTEADFAKLAGKSISQGQPAQQAPPSEIPPPVIPSQTPVEQTIASFSSSNDPQMQMMAEALKTTQQYLDSLVQQGKTINPNIEITPEQTASFLAQAQREIDPYYSNQMKLARENLLTGIGYSTDQITAQEANWEKQYGKALRGLGETSAESGMALSGGRQLGETELAQGTQEQIDQARKQAQFNAGQSARQFAQDWGTAQLPTATLGATPQVKAGQSEFVRGGSQTPFYELSGDTYSGLIGSQDYARQTAEKTRASELEGAFRGQKELSTRKLTL